MDPRSNSTPGLGLPQPGNDSADDMGQLPPIHVPEAFRAPDTAASHFDTTAPQIGAVPPSQPVPIADPAVPPAAVPAAPVVSSTSTDSLADDNAGQFVAPPAEDTDTNFDEEWVAKARKVVARTRNDPFLQSQELGKLKAQYIKLRYNKDIKVE